VGTKYGKISSTPFRKVGFLSIDFSPNSKPPSGTMWDLLCRIQPTSVKKNRKHMDKSIYALQ
jgi:hypothetical protein